MAETSDADATSQIATEPPVTMASEAPAHHPCWLHDTYFNDTTLADLTIKLAGGKTLQAHRIVLCRRSKYFAKLLTGNFVVRSSWRPALEVCMLKVNL